MKLGLIVLSTVAVHFFACTSDSSGNGPAEAATDPNVAARAAVLLGSCFSDDGVNRNLEQIYRPVENADAEVDLKAGVSCLGAKSNGCEALRECLGISTKRVGSECPARCDGNTYVACDDLLEFRLDCSTNGKTCVMADGRPTCQPTGATITPCNDDSFQTGCEDGRPTYCASRQGKQAGPRCADFGLVCAEYSGAGPSGHFCRGPGEECQGSTFSARSAQYEGVGCSGDDLDACVNGAKATLACPNVGQDFKCQTRDTKSFCGLAADCVPGSAAGRATCEGTSVVFCNAGKVTKIDCTTLGFTGCDTRNGVCTPSAWPQ